MKARVLPIKLESGRFKGVKEHLWLYEICRNGEIEDKMHYLYCCEPLQRDNFNVENNLGMKLSEEIDECGYTKIFCFVLFCKLYFNSTT